MNYTYPELLDWASLDAKTRNTRIRTDINALYGRTAPWGTMNSGLFNVAPSVPTHKPTVSSFGAPPTKSTPATAPAARVGAEAPVQQPVHAHGPILGEWLSFPLCTLLIFFLFPFISGTIDADAIRKAMEAGAQAAKDKAAKEKADKEKAAAAEPAVHAPAVATSLAASAPSGQTSQGGKSSIVIS